MLFAGSNNLEFTFGLIFLGKKAVIGSRQN